MNVMNVMKRNYENFAMETFYSTKNDFSNFGYCNRKWLCAAVF